MKLILAEAREVKAIDTPSLLVEIDELPCFRIARKEIRSREDSGETHMHHFRTGSIVIGIHDSGIRYREA